MSFKDDLEADLEVFFNEDEFAEPVTVEPKGGGAIEALAIVDYGDNQAEDRRGNQSRAEIELKRSIGIFKYGDTIEIDGEDWQLIREIRRDKWVIRYEIRSDLRGHYSRG